MSEGLADDWYRAARDESGAYGGHGAASADAWASNPHGEPQGAPGYSSAGHSASGYAAPGYSSAGYAQAPAPQPVPPRRGWIAPAALAVVAVASFGIVTVVMNHHGSSTADAPAISGSATTTSSPGSATPSASVSNSPATATVTTTTTQTTGSQSATSATSQPPAESTPQTVAAFPSGTTTSCLNDDGTPGRVSDPDVVQSSTNSCNFLPAVKDAVWSHEATSNDTAFDLSVYSSYRVRNDKELSPMVPITCTRSAGLTNCRNNAKTGDKGGKGINIWVRDKH